MSDVIAVASDLGPRMPRVEGIGVVRLRSCKALYSLFRAWSGSWALAFTLAVQQLLKPVHRFRLATRHLTLSRLYICVFGGVASVVLAAILHGGPWGYPINWKILATLLFGMAYGAVVIAIVRPGIPRFREAREASLMLMASRRRIIWLRENFFRQLRRRSTCASINSRT